MGGHAEGLRMEQADLSLYAGLMEVVMNVTQALGQRCLDSSLGIFS